MWGEGFYYGPYTLINAPTFLSCIPKSNDITNASNTVQSRFCRFQRRTSNSYNHIWSFVKHVYSSFPNDIINIIVEIAVHTTTLTIRSLDAE